MITENSYDAIVAVVEKMALLVWNSTESEKIFPDFLMDIMNRGREIYNSSIIMRK